MKIVTLFCAFLLLGSMAFANCESVASAALTVGGITSRPQQSTYADPNLQFAIATASISESEKVNLVALSADAANELYLSNSHAGIWLVITISKSCSVISLTQLQAI